MKFLRKLLFMLTLLWQIPTILSLLAYYVSPDFHWLPMLFGMGFPVVLLVNVLLLLFWLWRHKKYALVPFVTILLGLPQLNATVNFSLLDGKAKKPEQKLKVMSYNVRGFFNSKDSKKSHQQFVDYIKKTDPDILCMQEAFAQKSGFSRIRPKLQYKHYYATPKGVSILSKFPITATKIEKFQGTGNSALYVDISFNKKTIRLIDLHFESHRFDKDDYELIENPNLEEKQQIRSTLSKVARASRRHVAQAKIINQYIKESPHPIILCGDFNDPPATYTYALITKHLNDSFQAKGLGLGSTYAGPLPGLRIDYIMASDHFRFLSHKVDRFGFSDHYPVVSEVEVVF